MSLSQTTVVGRLTKDPEVRNVLVGGQETPVANFSVACDRDFGEGTDFYDVVVWRKQAENVKKFLSKGREVLVLGRMQKRTYTAKVPGTDVEYPRDVWEIHADKVQFLGSAKDSGGGQGGGGNYQSRQQTPPAAEPAYDPYAGGAPF
jgi:single-strand DNA-binding protein